MDRPALTALYGMLIATSALVSLPQQSRQISHNPPTEARSEVLTPPPRVVSVPPHGTWGTRSTPSTNDLIAALDLSPTLVLSISLQGTDPRTVAVYTSALGVQGFPVTGDTFAILSTGLADAAALPNTAENTTFNLDGLKNAQGNDLARLFLALLPPPGARCVGLDFAFYSEEYAEYIGSAYNDTFTIETISSTQVLTGNTIVAPNNIAFDTLGNLISINSAFGVSPNTGTTYDGATPRLHASTRVTAGVPISLYLSIQDIGDASYDSAVFLDHVAWSPNRDCRPGAIVPLSDVQASASTPTVFGRATQFTATLNSAGLVTFTWDFGDDSAPMQTSQTAHLYSAPGEYIAVLSATDGIDVVTRTVPVTVAVPVLDMSASPRVIVANGISTSLIVLTATLGVAGQPALANEIIRLGTDLGDIDPLTVTTDAAGLARATFTARDTAGVGTVSATLATARTTIGISLTEATAGLVSRLLKQFGTVITYTYVVSNLGPDAARDAILTGVTPPNTRVLPGRVNGGWFDGGNAVYTATQLSVGDVHTLTYVVEPILRVGDIVARASAASRTSRFVSTNVDVLHRLYFMLVQRR